MESKKIICYANLNSFNSSTGVTDEQMHCFFAKYFEKSDAEIVDVIVDRCKDETPIKERSGWKKLTERCKEQKIRLVVIPTVQMLGASAITIIDITKEFDYLYGTNIYAILEEFDTNDGQFRQKAELYATIQYNSNCMKQRVLKIRDVFFKATGIEGVPSAVPVYVDYDQYIKVEKVAHDYGLSMREFLSSLLTFASVSRQVPELEDHLFGLEHPKPTRGRPPKGRK